MHTINRHHSYLACLGIVKPVGWSMWGNAAHFPSADLYTLVEQGVGDCGFEYLMCNAQ